MDKYNGVLHTGKKFRPNKKRSVADTEEFHSEFEERETSIIL
jgi:hypothetical protein